jgi:TolA-binding protein
MKKLIIATILFSLLISPISALAYVNPGYGADLTCTTTNYTMTPPVCNNKEDMYKRIAELEKRVNELESKECTIVSGSIKLDTEDRISVLERKMASIESAVKDLQDGVMAGLKNILMFLMIKK